MVGGWTPGEGAAKELGALVVGYYEREGERKLRFAGKVGSGFNTRRASAFGTDWRRSGPTTPPFDPPPPRDYSGRWGGELGTSSGSEPES